METSTRAGENADRLDAGVAAVGALAVLSRRAGGRSRRLHAQGGAQAPERANDAAAGDADPLPELTLLSAPQALVTKQSRSACARIAATTRGCWWPRLQHSTRLLMSRIERPSSSCSNAPAPPITVGAFHCDCMHQL